MKRLMRLLFIFSTLILTACSNPFALTPSPHATSHKPMQQSPASPCPTTSSPPLTLTPPKRVVLTVMGWSSTTAEDALMRSLFVDFERSHPSISIQWTSVPGNYEDTMSALNARGELPDVFFMAPTMASTYIAHQKLLDLSPYMQRDQVQTSAYFPILFTPFMCNHQAYGIPKDWNTLGIVYNKTLFRKAGLAFPDASWTWSDLRTAALKLTNLSNPATPQYGISLPDSSGRWLAFLFAAGGSVLDPSQKVAAFSSPEAAQALNFYTSMQLQDHSSILPGALGETWAGPVFGSKHAAMAIEGGWLIPYLAENYPDIDYGIAPLPIGPNNRHGNLLFTNAWAASANTQSPAASWELIRYMTSAATQTRILHSGLALPSLASIAHDPFLQHSPNIKTLFDALPYSTLDYYGPYDNFIHNRLDIVVQNVLLQKMTVAQALAIAAQQVNRTLSSP